MAKRSAIVKRSELDGSVAEQLARWPSYGPAWDEAIAAGCDVALLDANLRLTPAERLEQLDAMTRLWWSLNPDTPDPGRPDHAGVADH